MKNTALGIINILLILLITACTTSDGDGIVGTGFDVKGSAEKGPFGIGSSVIVSRLNQDGTATSNTIATETIDDLGNFVFNVDDAGLVKISVEGYHFNEVLGAQSGGTLLLRGIYEVTDAEDQSAHVNILTHLVYKRLERLITQDKTAAAALSQAEGELIDTLRPVFPVDALSDFSQLSLFNINQDNATGNAYLLALSATINRLAYEWFISSDTSLTSYDAQLSLLVNRMAEDFAFEGELNEFGIINELVLASRLTNPADVKTNLEKHSETVLGQRLPIPNIDLFIDTDGDGKVNHVDVDDDNDGINDVDDTQSPYGLFPNLVARINSDSKPVILFPPPNYSSKDTLTIISDLSTKYKYHSVSLILDGEVITTRNTAPFNITWNPYYFSYDNPHNLAIFAQTTDGIVLKSDVQTIYVDQVISKQLTIRTPSQNGILKDINKVDVTWDEIGNAVEYEYQLSSDKDFLMNLFSGSIPSNSVEVSLPSVGIYYFRVKATNVLGKQGGWGPTQTIRLENPDLPTNIQVNVQLIDSKYNATLSWDAIDPRDNFDIYFGTAGSLIKENYKTAETNLVIPNLEIGKYEFQIQRTNHLNQKSLKSDRFFVNAGVFDKIFSKALNNYAHEILALANGNYAVLASAYSGVGANTNDWIFGFKMDGSIAWEYTNDNFNTSGLKHLTELPNGMILASGSYINNGLAILLDSDGKKIWKNTYTNTNAESSIVEASIAVGNQLFLIISHTSCTQTETPTTCTISPEITSIDQETGIILSRHSLNEPTDYKWHKLNSTVLDGSDILLSGTVRESTCSNTDQSCRRAIIATVSILGEIKWSWVDNRYYVKGEGRYATKLQNGEYLLSGQIEQIGSTLIRFASNKSYISDIIDDSVYQFEKSHLKIKSDGTIIRFGVHNNGGDPNPKLFFTNAEGNTTVANEMPDYVYPTFPGAFDVTSDGGLILLTTSMSNVLVSKIPYPSEFSPLRP